MNEVTSYELPKASEKLSYKFILDAIKEQTLEEEKRALDEELVSPVIETHHLGESPHAETQLELKCGTEVTVSNSHDDIPVEELPLKELRLEPGKKYFRIGEVSELIGVEPYVLRYWEGEFAVIKPVKSGSGHRVYGRKDVETLHLIRHLLHEEKYSVKGAKKKLLERRKTQQAHPMEPAGPNRKWLKELAQNLKEIIQLARLTPGNG